MIVVSRENQVFEKNADSASISFKRCQTRNLFGFTAWLDLPRSRSLSNWTARIIPCRKAYVNWITDSQRLTDFLAFIEKFNFQLP